MKTKQITTPRGGAIYLAPTIETITIAVENGFAASLNQEEDYTGGDVEQM